MTHASSTLVLAHSALGAPVLAWRPFLDPLPLHGTWWVTIIPLALFICMAYKAVRVIDLAHYWRQVFIMTAQTVAGMFGLAALVYLLIEVAVPIVAP